MLRLILEGFQQTSACGAQWQAIIRIEHDIADLSDADTFELEINQANPNDLYDYQDMIHYMSYGIFMSYELYMGGDEIAMDTKTTNLTPLVLGKQDTFFIALNDDIVNGLTTLLLRVIWTRGVSIESSDFALGYMPVDTQSLAGDRRAAVTPMRQAFRGMNDSNKYDRQFLEAGQDISLLESLDADMYFETTDLARIEYLSRLVRI